MDSGPKGVDGFRERQRWTENKVYTRKNFKGQKKDNNNNGNNMITSCNNKTVIINEISNLSYLPSQTLPSEDLNLTQKPVDVVSVNSPIAVQNPTIENVSFPSSSKKDKRELKRKLENDLDVIRNLIKRAESEHGQSNLGSSQLCLPESSNDGVGDEGFKRVNLDVASPQPANHGLDGDGLNMLPSVVASMNIDNDGFDNANLKRVHSDVAYPEPANNNYEYGKLERVDSDVADPKPANGDFDTFRLKRVHSDVAPKTNLESIRPLHQLSVSVLHNSLGVIDNVEKEKRTPKANQFYRNSEFLLAKDKFPSAESNKKSKSNEKKLAGSELGFGGKYYKLCNFLLEKLMKHRHGWVFNTPVDVKALGLHDYFTIITHPMDLGTVKSKLNSKLYKSPREYAEDVRLTFHNAMTYNPKGQDVHTMAEELSNIFEFKWTCIETEYNRELKLSVDYELGFETPSRNTIPALLPPRAHEMGKILDRSKSMTHSANPKNEPAGFASHGRTLVPKKPKAKDPHKRDMTYEEKQKLSTNLQILPTEKLDLIIQIIKKGNSALSQHDDEIEVDIDSVNAETLWELDRFVTNYKKSLSKKKRQAELSIQARVLEQKNLFPSPPEISKEAANKDVLISSVTLPEKRMNNESGSSSSSSSSSDSGSSSSASDSESLSADGSDGGHSPKP